MQVYKAPTTDMRFIYETLGYDRISAMKAFEDFDLDTTMAILEETGKFCTNEMLPLNRSADQEGVSYDPETHDVKTPEGFKSLYKKYVESGMGAIAMPVEYGGGGAPHTLAVAIGEFACATNKSFSMCPGLGHGLVEALVHFGTDEQKSYYLPKIISGEWTGTMCLTEPQCGTDLGLMRTKAEPDGDGYLITGTKVWITFGEHDLADNIIHLVLARLPDAPEGIKGISLFVVPKILDTGERNPVFCGGLEHKMGIHASPTCVINLEAAKGFLVGEPHKGMKGMFVMMNHARLGVGLEGIALSEIAYQTSVAFSRDRRQGRSLNKERNDEASSADNILVHPDVRRQLLNVRASTEGMRALAIWTAMNIDIAHAHEDEDERRKAKGIVELMTPIVKAYCTERGFNNVSEAMQVTGGSGYTTDWCIEQYLRDARIAMIYEGTNHIQALDLIGRKLPKGGGALYRAFSKEVYKFTVANSDVYGMGEFASALGAAINTLNETTMNLGMKGMADPEAAAAVASNYLNMFGIVAVAYMWGRMAEKALAEESKFNMTKLKMARYYYNQILPEIDSIRKIIEAGKDHMMAFEPSEF